MAIAGNADHTLIAITNIRPATDDEWDVIWKECSYATYFHSREWAQIWDEYTLGRTWPEPKIVSFSDGKRALLPLSMQKTLKGLVTTCVSSPAGTYGGWIATDMLTNTHALLLADYLVKNNRDLTWRLNPYDTMVSTINIPATDDRTQVIDLSAGLTAIYKKFSKGHASAVKKALSAGVSIIPAAGRDEWAAYYHMYEDSLSRWGRKATSCYDKRLFDIMFDLRSPYIKLWLAIYKGMAIAGELYFYAKRHAVTWHGAALKSYFNLRPVNLLAYEVIKDAIAKNYRWFDFNPSGGHGGVEDFKKSFGSETIGCPVVRKESLAPFLCRKIRFKGSR